jgi:hypothetical protein
LRETGTAARHRALQVLAGSPDGCTEAVMLAHGFAVELLLDLFREGLVTAKVERMRVADRWINVVRVRITDAGRAGGHRASLRGRRDRTLNGARKYTVHMIRIPSPAEWDTSQIPASRRACLDSGCSFEATASRALTEMQVLGARIKPYEMPARGEPKPRSPTSSFYYLRRRRVL